MIFQIGLLIWGIVILAKQEVKMTRNKVVKGGPAIAIGVLFVTLIPSLFLVGLVLGIVSFAAGGQEAVDGVVANAAFLEFGVLILFVVVAFIIASKYGKHPDDIDQQPYKANSDNPYAQPDQYQKPIDTSNPYSAPRDDRY